MIKLLVAVDGSDNSLRAVASAIRLAAQCAVEIHVVNVQPRLHGGVAGFVNAAQIKEYHHEEGLKEIAKARELMDQSGLAYQHHMFVGDPAETIARFAKESSCDQIILGTRGLGAVSNMLLGSVVTKVLHLTDVPVVLVK
ncbi:MAG: UspA protein [Herminiimonas sp.]|nr:UspA protein [Herminiimonas sp.]